MPTHKMMKAERWRPDNLGSFGKASYMILTQSKFPAEYDPDIDTYLNADHDRIQGWNRERFNGCLERHVGTGELAIGDWVMEHSKEAVMLFLIDILDANRIYPGKKWTGFRVMGTVNRSNGYPVFSLCLIAQKSKFKTYNGQAGENVTGMEKVKGEHGHTFYMYDPDNMVDVNGDPVF